MDFSQASSNDHEDQEDQIFSCRIENAKVVTDILSAIHAGSSSSSSSSGSGGGSGSGSGGVRERVCEVRASARAVVFSILGRGKSTQARATLQAGLFEEYIFECGSEGLSAGHSGTSGTESVMHFSINLTTLLDCLLLFGSTSESTSATLTYSVMTCMHVCD